MEEVWVGRGSKDARKLMEPGGGSPHGQEQTGALKLTLKEKNLASLEKEALVSNSGK